MLIGGSRPMLMAKLLVPRLPATTVARPRLDGRLRVAPHVRLTTVVAPAGWGKTTMLAAWAGSDDRRARTGWLSIDEADDEPVRFWTYALSALELAAPRVVGEALAALTAPGMDPVGVALAALLNALTDCQESYALVLDDYHVLRAPEVHQTVEFLLAYLPPALNLVIAARADPPLPLARMRARGELNEIRVAELRCTTKEGVELVTGVTGLRGLVPEATEQLVERAEGWPAGLQLAGLTLREFEKPEVTAAGLRGARAHILDYFAAEVLPGLSDAQRDLLVRCSVLERLNGHLCDAVLGTNDAADVLVQLHRDGVFISALGDDWYRCHRLFREVLRRELTRQTPEGESLALHRAADWFLDEGRLEEAIELLQAAGDYTAAVEVLLSGDRWFMERGASASFLRLGEQSASKVNDPRLFVALAAAAGETGEGERCRRWLQAAEPLVGAASEPLPGWRSLRAEADVMWAAFPAAGDAQAALTYATRAAALEDDPTLVGYVVAREALGGALLGAGRLPEAIAALRECWQAPARRDLPWLLLLQTAGLLAQLLVEVGDLEAAQGISREVRDSAAEAEEAWGQGAAAAVASLRLAEARLVLAADPRAALPALQRAAELAEGWGWPTAVLAALAHLAGAQWAVGQQADARRTLARAMDIASSGEARPVIVQRLQALEARIGRDATASARARGALVEELTDRELAILRALRGPLSAREIGAEMYLSINTVKGYTKSLYRKLDVATRAEAVHRGQELGLI